jgi:alpha-D-ribose 1-methylphosphonate 5-triphosphate synthase subunit PhnG
MTGRNGEPDVDGPAFEAHALDDPAFDEPAHGDPAFDDHPFGEARPDVTAAERTGAMTPERRYEHLGRADGEALEALADRILAGDDADVTVLAGPEAVTTPIRLPVPDARATAVIGHVALTTCTVALGGVRGDGCRTGRDLTGAVAAALCDAEVERGGPAAAAVLDLLHVTAGDHRQRRAADARVVELTRTDPTP